MLEMPIIKEAADRKMEDKIFSSVHVRACAHAHARERAHAASQGRAHSTLSKKSFLSDHGSRKEGNILVIATC